MLPLAGVAGEVRRRRHGAVEAAFDLAGRDSVFSRGHRLRLRRPRQRRRRCVSDDGAEVALPSARCRAPPAGVRRRRGRPGRGARCRTGHPPGQQLRRARRLGPRREADLLRADHPAGQLVELPAAQARRRRPVRGGQRGDLLLPDRRPDQVTPSRTASGYHRTYTGPEHEAAGLAPIDETLEVRDHDVVLVPHGYHGPCVAAPGYPMYYLNVMAGPGPSARWRSATTRPTAGSATTWAGVALGPARCPMTSRRRRLARSSR